MKHILHVVAKKQFVAKHFFVAVENRLPRYVAKFDALGTLASRHGGSGRSGAEHNAVIGSKHQQLQHTK